MIWIGGQGWAGDGSVRGRAGNTRGGGLQSPPLISWDPHYDEF